MSVIHLKAFKLIQSVFVLLALLEQALANDVQTLSLQDLLNQKTELHQSSTSVSGISESIQDAPAAIIVIRHKDIERKGYASIDEILQDIPGFDTSIPNGTVYSIAYQRGYRTNWTQRTLVLIDGKVDNSLWTHSAIISRQFPLNAIERIEVIYGPASVVYGPNAFLGVINIITKDANNMLAEDDVYAEIAIEKGSFNTQGIDLSTGFKYGLWHGSLGLRLFNSDEAHINDLSPWGYTDPALLQDPTIWGPGIGQGVDPVTSRTSPLGDINVNGEVEQSELFNGQALGQYFDPSFNRGVLAKLAYDNLAIEYINWHTDEGYGPYYSFADAQPNASWVYGSEQVAITHQWQLSKQLDIKSQFVYRNSQVAGDWIESYGTGVSISKWNSYSDAWRFEQEYQYRWSPTLMVSGGIKYEQKQLMKGYMICNYWANSGICPAQGVNSESGFTSDGSGVINVNEISSNHYTTLSPDARISDNPDFNTFKTRDQGVYGQLIWDVEDWRFSLGTRWDNNSLYKEQVSPRLAAIYHYSPKLTFKWIYGEAFQEPAPVNLYGGWNGRINNEGLKPEKVTNFEFITQYQTQSWLHDVSLYASEYTDVIADSSNVQGRDIWGVEYRGHYRFANPIPQAATITGQIYYTYTDTQSDMQYDNQLGQWLEQKAETGDIAANKISWHLNWPLSPHWNINTIVNWVGRKALFSQNPLRQDSNSNREQDIKLDSYTTTDVTLRYDTEGIDVGLKIENLFETEYYSPGPEGAGAGDNFTQDGFIQDNDGFHNSLLPQLKTRTATLFVEVEL
ncbi:TonB-dependent receptor [Saccharobesus litoralis]|uniref:TonB-dependent receptor n=1 Tax=Saccharobesus litoralis TaxID=2172099 RepID=A0A2S0VM75_9ALTE|nr:TonB-dependent receptor [Saccharobesus litoralis]AWB65311.1 TonB-dependent receptor [Saccharobesus litoralis]